MVTPVQGRRYKIVGTIGKGGFGTVYKAEMLGEGNFSKVVALKVLNPEAALIDEVAQRLRDEARILGLVHHRAIVQVDGLVRFDTQWTIVMEYLEGIDLREAISEGPLPPAAALEVVEEVAGALHQAWIQPGPDGQPLEMLHRDIKPSNVVVTAAGEVKVLDFGTARANFGAREAKTQSMAFGTIDFMSPERLEFVDVAAGDSYAVGCVLFELLTGERVGRTSPDPVKHTVVFEGCRQALADHVLSDEVRDLVLECLAFDPEGRPTADQISRRCRRERSQLPEHWLVDWAREAVPPKIAARGALKTDGMTGKILIESSTTRRRPKLEDMPPSEPGTVWVRQPHPNRTHEEELQAPAAVPMAAPVSTSLPVQVPQGRSMAGLLVAVFTVAGGAVLLAIGAAWYLTDGFTMNGSQDAVAPVPAEVLVEVEPVQPAPVAEPEVVEPAPEPVAEPVPKAKPRPRSRPAAVATGTVTVAGDAEAVVLIDGSGNRFPTGKVTAGTYTIEATFANRGAVQAGTVTVKSGQTATITCRGMFGRCDVSLK